MTLVYWIHCPEHKDILSQGYIGVTQNISRRLNEHQLFTNNKHLTNAWNKYEKIITSILLKGSEEYCYYIENLLRSKENIGWNIAIGGNKPPMGKGNKGSKFTRNPFSAEHKHKLKLAKIGNTNAKGSKYSDEIKKQMSIARKGKHNPHGSTGPKSEEYKQKMSVIMKEYNLLHPRKNKKVKENA